MKSVKVFEKVSFLQLNVLSIWLEKNITKENMSPVKKQKQKIPAYTNLIVLAMKEQ